MIITNWLFEKHLKKKKKPHHINGDFTDFHVSTFLTELFDTFLLVRNLSEKSLFQICLIRKGPSDDGEAALE